MKVYESWHGLKNLYPLLVVGLGNFDGVHLGHRELIGRMVARAREMGAVPAVFTFHPHPLSVLDPANAPPLLLSQRAKERLIAGLGVEVLLRIPFTREFARLGPEDFVRDVLWAGLGVEAVFVGYNYTFGHQGRGTPGLLQECGRLYGFEVHVLPPVEVGGQVVSSTLIRQMLAWGEVDRAARLMGYCPFVEGRVVAGDRRGGALGFPTANLEPEDGLLVPANGVYAVEVEVGRDRFLGVANIGTRPTFYGQNARRQVEVHLLDFHGNLYGCWMVVHFKRRLREERRFASVADLVAQIRRDISMARLECGQ